MDLNVTLNFILKNTIEGPRNVNSAIGCAKDASVMRNYANCYFGAFSKPRIECRQAGLVCTENIIRR
jgi:hypothetical protein